MKFDITSPSKFQEQVATALSEKAQAIVSQVKQSLKESAKVMYSISVDKADAKDAKKKLIALGFKPTMEVVGSKTGGTVLGNKTDKDYIGNELAKIDVNAVVKVISGNGTLKEEIELETDNNDDIPLLKNIADSIPLKYTVEVEDGEVSFNINDDNTEEAIDAFFDKVDAQGIDFEIDSDEEEEDSNTKAQDAFHVEEAKLLKRTKPLDKLKRKQNYRKNKAKIKLNAKKFRRTAKYKKYTAKSKRLGKLGKTSTGKRQTRRS